MFVFKMTRRVQNVALTLKVTVLQIVKYIVYAP